MSSMPLWLDLLLSALMVLGAAFALIGAWGLARLSDFYKRLHGPTKASTLGVGSVLLVSMACFAWTGAPHLHELLITAFVFMTAPVSAHLLVKAALHLTPSAAPPLPDLSIRPSTAASRRPSHESPPRPGQSSGL